MYCDQNMKTGTNGWILKIFIVSVIILIVLHVYGFQRNDVDTDSNFGRNLKSSVEEITNDVSEEDDGPFKRSKHLTEYCDKLHQLGQVPVALKKNSYQYMYVNDQYKFIFCMMPKLACTNWKRVFLALNDEFQDRKDWVLNTMNGGFAHAYHAKYNKILSQYSDQEIEEKLKTYKKITFVRDPFERLLSAYNDKMFRNDSQVFIDIARRIVKLKRKDKSVTENVTFLEFVRYITDPDTFESSYEQHWTKYTFLCEPCIVKYDFIGKFETMNDDVDLAFKYIGIDDSIQFPHRSAAYKNTKSSDIVDKFYKNIPEKYLRKLYQLFKSDYVSFSYPLPKVLSGLSDL